MNNDVVIRKRTQIANANRTMFIWVAGASILVGFALVAIVFLVQIISYNEKVLAKKAATLDILTKDNKRIPELRAKIRALDANKALEVARVTGGDYNPVQVILEALPSTSNSNALGASLQNIFSRVNGLEVISIVIDPTESDGGPDSGTSTPNEIVFKASLKGTSEVIKNALLSLEQSLRTIKVDTLILDGKRDGSLDVKITGRAFYVPPKVVELTEVTIK